jgi:hypothetical protein
MLGMFSHPRRPQSGHLMCYLNRTYHVLPTQLGFTIAKPTVSRYLRRLKHHPEESKTKRWRAFLNNHREAIAAFDFFTVPSLM